MSPKRKMLFASLQGLGEMLTVAAESRGSRDHSDWDGPRGCGRKEGWKEGWWSCAWEGGTGGQRRSGRIWEGRRGKTWHVYPRERQEFHWHEYGLRRENEVGRCRSAYIVRTMDSLCHPTAPRTCCVFLGKLLNLSVPQVFSSIKSE